MVDVLRATGTPTSCLLDELDEVVSSAVTDGVAASLARIVRVHPLAERAARVYVARCGGSWEDVEAFIDEGRLARVGAGDRRCIRSGGGTDDVRSRGR